MSSAIGGASVGERPPSSMRRRGCNDVARCHANAARLLGRGAFIFANAVRPRREYRVALSVLVID